MPKRFRPLSPQIIEYKQLKTAAGGSGSSGGGGGPFYKEGQIIACKVHYAEKDGYAVNSQKYNLPGFMKTSKILKPGDDVLGVFVCVHNGRMILSQLFLESRGTKHQSHQNTVNWFEHLDKDALDAAYKAQAAKEPPTTEP